LPASYRPQPWLVMPILAPASAWLNPRSRRSAARASPRARAWDVSSEPLMTPSCPRARRPTSVSCETGRRLQHLFDAGHFGNVMAHHLLDPGLQGRGGGGAARAGAAHPQTQHAGFLVEMVEQDVAAVLGHRRTDAAVEQALDLGDDLRVL